MVAKYSLESISDAVYLIGGAYRGEFAGIISQFKNYEWSRIGTLQKPRDFHASITYDLQTMVIGGYTDDNL